MVTPTHDLLFLKGKTTVLLASLAYDGAPAISQQWHFRAKGTLYEQQGMLVDKSYQKLVYVLSFVVSLLPLLVQRTLFTFTLTQTCTFTKLKQNYIS